MAGAPRISMLDIRLAERETPFAHPFRFGAVTVREAPQAFVHATVDVEGFGRATGVAAEMMMPRWFDKNPALTVSQSIDALRDSLLAAQASYLAGEAADTAFSHHARVVSADAGAGPALVRQYGVALIDKAVLDGLCKAMGLDAASALRTNAPGMDARLTPDLTDDEVATFLGRIAVRPHIALRWTVGMLDPLGALERELVENRLTYMKIKLGGDVGADIERLATIAPLVDAPNGDMRFTLDANEQYDPARLTELFRRWGEDPRLSGMRSRLLYVEQPFDRRTADKAALGDLARQADFIIDESDGDYGAFPRAIALGYRGVSAKSCKGIYKAILNAARAARGDGLFVSAEDLTCVAGLCVGQDIVLGALIGARHAERNGHHYVDGFAGAGPEEADRFAAAYPDLYRRGAGGVVRLDTAKGTLPTASLFAHPGLGGGAVPDEASLGPIHANGQKWRTFA